MVMNTLAFPDTTVLDIYFRYLEQAIRSAFAKANGVVNFEVKGASSRRDVNVIPAVNA